MAHDVFISYRREGGLDLAGRIKDHLVLAGYNPFYDVETMKSGRFDKQLYEKIGECEHFLLILPPKGLNRCRNKRDWVRKEIEYAIQQKKHIITVLMPGFSFSKKLPHSIDVIRYVQAVVPTPETFEHTIEKIVEYLKDQNWSSVEYDVDINQEIISPLRKVTPVAIFFVFLFLVIGLFLWHPWSDSSIISHESKSTTNDDKSQPVINIGKFDSERIVKGGSMLCTIFFADNITIAEDSITPEYIDLDSGWTAEIEVFSSDQKKVIEFRNIQGMIGYHHFTIKEGAVVDSSGNKSNSVQSFDFYLMNNDTVEPTIVITKPKFTADGDIKFSLYVDDEASLESFSVDPERIILIGFEGDISIIPSSQVDACTISITNYKKLSDECYIVIPAGVAKDQAGNQTRAIKSASFKIDN